MVTIKSGATKHLPEAEPGERIDVLTFVVTKAGWNALKEKLKLQPNNPVRIVSRLFYQGALPGSIDIRQLKDNHAKRYIQDPNATGDERPGLGCPSSEFSAADY